MADCKRKTANLFDKTVEYAEGLTTYNYTISGLDSNKYYTCSTNFARISGVDTACLYFNGSSSASNGVWSDTPRTFKPNSSGEITVGIRYRSLDSAPAIYNDVMAGTVWVMINEGSTALPYEPYGWIHSLRKLGTDIDTITTLPADVYADGNNATVGLKGNMSQSGTPSPTTPIQPQECGETSSNLYNVSDKSATTNNLVTLVDLGADTTFNTFTVSCMFDNLLATGVNGAFLDFQEDDNTHHYVALSNMYNVTDESTVIASTITTGNYYATKNNITFRYIKAYLYTTAYNKFQSGTIKWAFYDSEKKDYEPYGYKLTISSASTTTPVYLGEVETTREIRKLVLTGQESGTWSQNSSITTGNAFYNEQSTIFPNYSPNKIGYCTHFATTTSPKVREGVYWGANINFITDINDNIDTPAKWKQYIAAQYAAGTPVTIWYVLATETTGIVNEPLRKIGDYADTVSGITIPTITGADSFDVQTTLKPSEVSLSYTGWHDSSVQEYVGGVVNKFNINTTWNPPTGQTATITVSGESVTITGKYYAYVAIPVTANETYTAKYSGTGDRVYVVAYRDTPFNTANMIAGLSTSGTTINVGDTDTLYILFYSGDGTQGTTTYSDIMLVEGSTVPSEYHPYYEWV